MVKIIDPTPFLTPQSKATTHCGYVALIGAPNVGKSTLLNLMVGQKISIISPKPQTTRQRILGIKTEGDTQTIFIDTPGIHQQAKRTLNRYMNRAATHAVHDADVIVFLVTALHWTAEEDWVLKRLQDCKVPIILAINKVDTIKDKSRLLPFIEQCSQRFNFAKIIPISATENDNVDVLEKTIQQYLPLQVFLFPEDQVTDQSERFLAAEVIREKLMRDLSQELPYAITVTIEQFERTKKILRISAVIYVERAGQKAIVIGAKGEELKKIGQEARLELEKELDQKIFLQLWVKVKNHWADDAQILKSLGFNE